MKTKKQSNHSVSKKKDKPKKDKSIFHKKSDAGKGDKIRRSISQDEWGKKYEKIFGNKEKKK